MHSKEEAFKEVSAIWPNSLGWLTHSINCFGLGSLDGQCFAGITSNKESISIDHYLRMVDSKEAEFIERLAFFAGKPDPEKMCLPDLTGYSKSICTKNDTSFIDLSDLLSQLKSKTDRNRYA